MKNHNEKKGYHKLMYLCPDITLFERFLDLHGRGPPSCRKTGNKAEKQASCFLGLAAWGAASPVKSNPCVCLPSVPPLTHNVVAWFVQLCLTRKPSSADQYLLYAHPSAQLLWLSSSGWPAWPLQQGVGYRQSLSLFDGICKSKIPSAEFWTSPV